MFDFLKSKPEIDIRDEAITEMLQMFAQFALLVIDKAKKEEITKDAAILAIAPIATLGELEALTEYLENSDVKEARKIGEVLKNISKDFSEFLKDNKDKND